jgi:hypothetical protein
MSETPVIRRSQVQIKFANLSEGRIIVERILLTATDKFKLYDNSHTSRVKNTIRSVVEGDGFGFGLGARVAEETIYVNFNGGRSNSPKFDEVHDFVLDELRRAFRLELSEISADNPSFVEAR